MSKGKLSADYTQKWVCALDQLVLDISNTSELPPTLAAALRRVNGAAARQDAASGPGEKNA